ncbi:MAG: mitochondrial fission ELM1 family protein [Parvularculaceae bacterium]
MTSDKQAPATGFNPATPLRIWAVSDGRAGMENQVRGLAEAVAALTPSQINIKRVKVDGWAEKLPDWAPSWTSGNAFSRVVNVTDKNGDATTLAAELPDIWPNIWIGCGRRITPLTRQIKKLNPATFTVQTQDPGSRQQDFDLIIPPDHDRLTGQNVFPIIGAPNRFSPDHAAQQATQLRAHLGHLPKPRLAVLIGGNSKAYALDAAALENIIEQLQLAVKSHGLMISFSRRTGATAETALRAALDHPDIWIWDGKPVAGLDNPYAAMLGLADDIAVTNESTNMITDAASTGKPVHLLALTGGNAKFRRFHDSLAHITQPFDLPLSGQNYPPLRETERAAKEILKRVLTAIPAAK